MFATIENETANISVIPDGRVPVVLFVVFVNFLTTPAGEYAGDAASAMPLTESEPVMLN